MAKSPRAKKPRAVRKPARRKAGYRLPLPDPKLSAGPYRPFASDPGWDEAWWWLGIPVAVALFVPLSLYLAPEWHRNWVSPESGILETAQFIMMVIGLAIAVQLLFDPIVRRRPLVLGFTIIAAVSCFYIAGEEVSWGQHIFFWEAPHLVSEVNTDGEFSIHNMDKAFERIPRALLGLGVLIGGLVIPLLCYFDKRWRASRLALFLPGAALVPTALLAAIFKFGSDLTKYLDFNIWAGRPSEAVEFYLYFFILAYLIVFERRISEMETAEAGSRN